MHCYGLPQHALGAAVKKKCGVHLCFAVLACCRNTGGRLLLDYEFWTRRKIY